MNMSRQLVANYAAMMKEHKQWSTAVFLNDFGREFTNIGKAETLGEKGNCYQNALTLATLGKPKGYLYCEGYAVSASLRIPLEHAWVAEEKTGLVIDPTWEDGVDYYGVAFDPFKALDIVLKRTKHWGILGNLWQIRTRSKRPLNEVIDALLIDALHKPKEK